MYGSDQSASLEPSGLRQLIGAVRKIEMAMGDGIKMVVADEFPIAKNLRQHLDWNPNDFNKPQLSNQKKRNRRV